jgi:hypothetical protein
MAIAALCAFLAGSTWRRRGAAFAIVAAVALLALGVAFVAYNILHPPVE